jgi:protein SCO1/2
MTARNTLLIAVLAIVAFALGLVLSRSWLSPRPAPPPTLESATLFETPRPLPALDLVDQDGQPLETLRDHWTLVFFGFTHCPDVCPTSLTLLAATRRQLLDLPAAQQPRVLLISVDPERDTPARLREYVRFFDPSFLGATGSLDGVQQAAGAFAVPYAKVPLPQGGYTMDHGAGVFVVAPSGNVLAYSSPPLQADVLARDYRAAVGWYQESSR